MIYCCPTYVYIQVSSCVYICIGICHFISNNNKKKTFFYLFLHLFRVKSNKETLLLKLPIIIKMKHIDIKFKAFLPSNKRKKNQFI